MSSLCKEVLLLMGCRPMLDVSVCHSRHVVVGVGWCHVGKILNEKLKLKMVCNK